MPYIPLAKRADLKPVSKQVAISPGELNFQLSKLVNQYLYSHHPDVNYEVYNAVIGALECCKLEVYRRLVGPYEDMKIKMNGDVFWGTEP